MSLRIFTVGHSNRSLEEFTDILDQAGVTLVVDVRKYPGSRRCPQFNEAALSEALGSDLAYRRLAALGGRRPVSTTVPPEVNGLWRNRSFHNYADYALSEEFGAGLASLRRWAGDHRLAVMCSEAVWWRCHRRIIADHLLAHGDEVVHLMGGKRADPASVTPGAQVHPDHTVTYPATIEHQR